MGTKNKNAGKIGGLALAAIAMASCTTVTEQASLGAAAPRSCPFCDMHGAALANQDFTDANLQGANLASADLRGAILDGAELARANLAGANLSGARLGRSGRGVANLSGANLEGANFTGAKLDKADLQYARIAGVTGLDAANAVIRPPAVSGTARAVDCGKADISGLKTMIFVTTAGTDGPACGDATTPCATLQKGIDRCSGADACGVLVLWGNYPLAATIQLADGVNVYGCVSQSSPQNWRISVVAPPNGAPAMSANGLKRGVVVQNFAITGSDPDPKDTQSASSIAITAKNSDAFQIMDSRVVAGAGGAGANAGGGADGVEGRPGQLFHAGVQPACAGANGGDGSPQQGVRFTGRPFPTGCESLCGGIPGDNNCRGFTSAGGAAGGQPGRGDCQQYSPGRVQFGDRGGQGRDSNACGAGGKASPDSKGSFAGFQWSGTASGSGTDGSGGGAGGGGGGAGGYAGVIRSAQLWAGERGGGGGSGGCGGKTGSGARQGGGSFAIVLDSSNLKLVDSDIVGGAGGAGGTGGSGGSGGRGARGFPGMANRRGPAGCGGDGGDGGFGPAGGGGAGGNGGPAIGVALIGNSSASASGNTHYYPGASQRPGSGGQGGLRSPGCRGSDGSPGIAGLVADQAKY